jgi:hypothetical protein
MIEQGYDMDPSLLYQDNMSPILLETNGRASRSKWTKHIKVKYFLVKDKDEVFWEEITIKHCPAEQMWTDINTKPKQGAVFQAFRGHVMGIPADYNGMSFATRCSFRPPTWMPETVLMLPIPRRDQVASQECVGDNTKGPEPTPARPVAKVRFAVDVEAHAGPTAEPTKQDRRAPIKNVGGRAWSPGIYQALRLLGESLYVAWEKAFIHPLTFN